MRKSLSKKGLSLSQAQSVSNLCNQRALDINAKLTDINNVSKVLTIGDKAYTETVAKPIPSNVVDLIKEKSILHATQAFLMENIKAKDLLLKEIKNRSFISKLEAPVKPKLSSVDLLKEVDEKWGWEQLSNSELNEFLEAEAFAAHIGQFIHKGGQLDVLRKELPRIKTLEWIEVKQGEKTPLVVNIHHTPEELLSIHNDLATEHRKYEQKVNYFKAKVKNLATLENARIAKENADRNNDVNKSNKLLVEKYNSDFEIFMGEVRKEEQEFELSRQNEISEVADLRIEVDARFKATIDSYLTLLDK